MGKRVIPWQYEKRCVPARDGQLPFFFLNTKKMTNFGAGQIVSRDNNPETGELFWTGWLFGDQSYYVQLVNGSETPIDYWLFTDNVISYPLPSARWLIS